MKRHRSILPAALALLFALVLCLGPRGVLPASAANKEPEVKLDLKTPAKGIRVAVLPLVNGTGEADVEKIMEDVLGEELRAVDVSRAVFLLPSDVERVLADANALDRADRVAGRWSRNGMLDSTAIAGLDSLLIADAVMVIKVTEWETKRVHNVGEGQSSTTVGLHLALFNIKDKKKIWSKDVRDQRMAREMDLTNSTVGYDGTGRIQTPGANEPPRIHDVVTDLLREALKKFPNK